MSWPDPMWRNQLRILVGGSRVLLNSYRRGLLPSQMREDCVSVSPQPGAEPWRAALAALPGAMAPSLAERPDVTVVLSNQFVRYVLLPPNPALQTPQEWNALARHRFTAIHGEVTNDWLVRVSETAPEGARIASAIDIGLLDALDDCFAGSGAHLSSVQPYLMTAFNHVQPQLGRAPCWLVIEEEGCLTLSLLAAGRWEALRSRWVDAGWEAELPRLLARKQALLGLDEPCRRAILCSTGTADARTVLPDGHGLELQRVDYDRIALNLH